LLATLDPPAPPDLLPDSARRVKRQHPGAREPLRDTALDPTRLARQTRRSPWGDAPNPLDTHACFIETIRDRLVRRSADAGFATAKAGELRDPPSGAVACRPEQAPQRECRNGGRQTRSHDKPSDRPEDVPLAVELGGGPGVNFLR
jgi:hypothetical protein